MRDARRNLLQKLKPFTRYGIFKIDKARRVAPGVSQAVDVTGTDRIRDNREHDGDRPRCLQERRKGVARLAENDVWSERYQFCDDNAPSVWIATRRAVLELDILPNGPAELLKRFPEDFTARLRLRIVGRQRLKDANAPHRPRLLGARDERPFDR